MPIWVWIEIAFAVVLAVAAVIIVVTVFSSRRKTKRLKQHYGSEYERLVSETGSEKAAKRELTTRERNRDKLDIVPLAPAAFSDFSGRWQKVQAEFVDDPAAAVRVADRLVTEVMRQRGYPVDDFEQRAADISVTTRRSSRTTAPPMASTSRSSMPTPSSSGRHSCTTGRCSTSCWRPRPTRTNHRRQAHDHA